jgi:hypothetical protein
MVTETVVQTDGLIDALARILRQLIRTPKFKEAAVILLNSIDPPAARKLVRVLFWEDTGLFLSIVGAVPSLINTSLELIAELAAQMNSMPAPLLREFIDRLVAGIDGEAAGEAAGGLVSMVLSLEDDEGRFPESLGTLGQEFGRSYRESAGEATLTASLDSLMKEVADRAQDKDSATHAFIQEAGRAMKSNPDFVEHVLKPLLSPALRPGAKKPGAKKPTGKK